MDAGLVLLILNILFAVFLVLGFIFGFVKGLKKSALRIGFFFVAVIVAGIITPYISKLILGIQITYEGQLTSIENIILSAINSSEQVAELMQASPTIATLIENFPIMLVNLVTFVLLTYLVNLVAWVIYLVVASVCFPKEKVQKDEIVVKTKSKKRKWRWFGGLVGAVQGLALAFLTFLPLSGIVGLYNDLSTATQTVQADTQESSNLSLSAQLINENIPEEFKEYISAYNDSAIAKVSGVFGIDDAIFNQVASVTIDGTKISLRDEVVNIANVYDNVGFLMDIDFSSWEVVKTLNYDNLLRAVDYIFNSNLLTTALPELVDFGIDKIIEMPEIQSNADYLSLVETIRDELRSDEGINENLKNELVSVINTAKIAADNKIFDQIPTDANVSEDDINDILDILSMNDKAVLTQIIDNIFNSKILNKAALFGLNYAVDFLEEQLIFLTDDQTIVINNIDIKDENLTLKKGEVTSLLSSALNIGKIILDENIQVVEENILQIFDFNLEGIVTNLGTMMNAVQNMNVFSQTGIYNQIVSAFAKTEYNNYVDFNIFKGDNVWLEETQSLANVIDMVRQSQIISYIEQTGENQYTVSDENITKIFQNLTKMSEINGESKTLLRQIIEPIYNSDAFKKLIKVGFENLNTVINELGDILKEGTVLGDINYDALYEENEKENLFAFADNIAKYVSTLDIKQFKENTFEYLLSSNLSLFGSCIDSIRASSIFSDIETENGVVPGIYTNLVDTLSTTQLNQFIDFNCFKDNQFSFNVEFTNLQPIIDKMLTKQITYQGETYNLISYILQVGNLENMLDQINSDDVNQIFTPLMNNRVFRPIGVLVVNSINSQIKDFVGNLGVNIPVDIDDLSEDEVAEVVGVLGSVIDLASDIMTNTSIEDLVTGESSDQLAGLLEQLEDSANKQGVFEGAYNAMLGYIQADETVGGYVSGKLDQFTTDGDIDWSSLIQDVKNEYTK